MYELEILKKSSKISKLTEEQESMLEKNIVWMFGYPRSGTSWLARDLLSYNTVMLNEPLIGRHLAYTLPKRIDMIRDIDFFKSQPRYFFTEKYKDTWLYYLRKLILNRIYAQFETFSKMIIIKEPNGSDGADILSECMPNSKIIVLLRDARDIMDSQLDAAKEGSKFQVKFHVKPLPNTRGRRSLFIKNSSDAWVRVINIVMKAYENHNKSLRHLLKYENLRYNTFEELKKIYQFLEVEIPQEDLIQIVNKYSFENIPKSKKGAGKVQRTATPNRWKNVFSSEEQEVMNTIMEPTLKKLGY